MSVAGLVFCCWLAGCVVYTVSCLHFADALFFPFSGLVWMFQFCVNFVGRFVNILMLRFVFRILPYCFDVVKPGVALMHTS